MRNDEYIKLFLRKHHYDGNIVIQSNMNHTWDNVKSIICNVKDIPSKIPISMTDIAYDILSDSPEDLFYNWLDYCKSNNSTISYKQWSSENKELYVPKNIDRSGIIEFENEISQSIDTFFDDFKKKYDVSQYFDDDSDDDEEDDWDEDEEEEE